MKKLYVISVAIALSVLFCACKRSDYKRAVSEMQKSDYLTAYNILSAIPEYRDSAKLASECAYQMANNALNLQDYEVAFNLFNDILEYKDSQQKSEECSVLLGYQTANAMKKEIGQAIAERDEAQLCQLISAYLTMEHAHDEISAKMNNFIMKTITLQFEQTDYDNFLFLDRLIALTDKSELLKTSIGNQLSEFDVSHRTQRTIAFLTGTWKRIDSSQSSGLRINVTCTEENSFAMILEDLSFVSNVNKNAKFHWDKGMLIWNDIQVVDMEHIRMDTMWLTSYYRLGVQANRYEDGIGYLDYDGMRIITQSTGEDDIIWHDNVSSDIYVKESAIKEVSEISETDFIISFEDANSAFEAATVNLNNWFSTKNRLFYAYAGVNPITTSRGISVGSEWQNVVEQYGYGHGNLYTEDSDVIYASLKKAKLKDEGNGELLCNILSSQADEYMEYSLDDARQTLRFYFDDGIVSWICLFTA